LQSDVTAQAFDLGQVTGGTNVSQNRK